MPRSETSGLSVAIFGALSVLGEELRRELEENPLGVSRVKLYEGAERRGSITEFKGEPMVVTTPDEEETGRVDLSFICSEDDPCSAQYLDWVTQGEGAAVDLVGAAAGLAGGGVPMVNFDVNPEAIRPGARVVSMPHPMAHPLSTILHRLGQAFTLVDVCATVLRPVSDGGRRAVEELHQQTIGVLSFTPLPTEVFGRQMAFNLLPVRFQGEEGRLLEETVRRDVDRVLGKSSPPLSLRIIQAPTFYGHCYLLRVRTGERPSPADVAGVLGQGGLFSISSEPDERTPVDLAARSGVWIADVSADGDQAGSSWLWIVTDAIRSGAARNATRLARRLTEARG